MELAPESLDEAIQRALDDFDAGIRSGLTTTERGEQAVKEADAYAAVLHALSENLTTADYDDITAHATLIQSQQLTGPAMALLEVRLARGYVPAASHLYRRCFELLSCIVEVEPTERVRRFLHRVSRCFLLGLEPETIILCRSVLESAVEERLDDTRRKGVREAAHGASMKVKIDLLHGQGWITDDSRRAAMVIWERGNAAIHKDPEAVGNAIEIIRKLVEVLYEIDDSMDYEFAKQ